MNYFYLAEDQSSGCFIEHRTSCCQEEHVLKKIPAVDFQVQLAQYLPWDEQSSENKRENKVTSKRRGVLCPVQSLLFPQVHPGAPSALWKSPLMPQQGLRLHHPQDDQHRASFCKKSYLLSHLTSSAEAGFVLPWAPQTRCSQVREKAWMISRTEEGCSAQLCAAQRLLLYLPRPTLPVSAVLGGKTCLAKTKVGNWETLSSQ